MPGNGMVALSCQGGESSDPAHRRNPHPGRLHRDGPGHGGERGLLVGRTEASWLGHRSPTATPTATRSCARSRQRQSIPTHWTRSWVVWSPCGWPSSPAWTATMPKTGSCSECGGPMWAGPGSLTDGRSTCRPCRRKLRAEGRPRLYKPDLPPRPPSKKRLDVCARCFGPKPGARFKYCQSCSRIVRKQSTPPKKPAAERGYGYAHQLQRRRVKPIVDRGEAYCHARECLEDSRWIQPGTPWDLGHTPDRTTWTGPEHRRCNRVEGASRGNRQRSRREKAWTL